MTKIFLACVCALLSSLGTFSQVDDLDVTKIKQGAVEYVRLKDLKKFPVPPIVYRHNRSEYDDLKESLANKVIYPILCEFEIPVSLIIVDFCSDMLKKEYKDKNACRAKFSGEVFVELEMQGADGSDHVTWISTNKKGVFENNEYLFFFGNNYIPKRNCMAETQK